MNRREWLQDERGVALIWALVAIPVLLLLLVLAADIMQWEALAHELQTAVDAAALAGAQEVWIRQEIDAAGVVYSQELFLNEEEAERQAQIVLDENLSKLNPEQVQVTAKVIEVDSEALTVRVTVQGNVKPLLAHRLGILSPVLSRTGTAEPAVPSIP